VTLKLSLVIPPLFKAGRNASLLSKLLQRILIDT
jgi:hypothetical protein